MRVWLSLVLLTVLCGFVHTQNTTNVTTADPIAALQSDVKSVKRDMDKGYVMLCAFVIFFMQAGFAFVEAGSVRSKNVSNILLKNLMNTSFCTLGWFVVGWGIAFGNRTNVTRNGFVGNGGFFLLDADDDYHNWFFQWCFCVAAAMVAGGSVAERTNLSATFFFNFVFSAVIYPVYAHWIWSPAGWLSGFNTDLFRVGTFGTVDFAGGAVVHTVGGVCGFVGAAMVGPRIGRFQGGKVVPIGGHNKTLSMLGGFILWFGWYGFNCGSTLKLSDNQSLISTYAAVNTTIAAACGAMTSMMLACVRTGQYDLTESLNGVFAGCVAITPVCAFVPPWSAPIIAAISALIMVYASNFLIWLKVDDPLNASPIHAACGVWGVICNGLFARKDNIALLYGNNADNIPYGLFLGGGWEILGTSLLGCVMCVLWTMSTSVIMFFIIDKLVGLRVTAEDEIEGLDKKTGGEAYQMEEVDTRLLGNMGGTSNFADDMSLGNTDVDAHSKRSFGRTRRGTMTSDEAPAQFRRVTRDQLSEGR